jgi:hypothetical protein
MTTAQRRRLGGVGITEGVGEIFEDGSRSAEVELANGEAGSLPVPVLREMVRLPVLVFGRIDVPYGNATPPNEKHQTCFAGRNRQPEFREV